MNKTLKTVLLLVGVILIIYGTYTLITPEASVSIGSLNVEAQDNTNSYITIILGLVAVILGYLASRKGN
ncbi:MAG: hypothetical protein R3213_05125 [Flavobacteriaceae bacterium]|nr:hypothetical protein [Flavobacteriaceae bacterium]